MATGSFPLPPDIVRQQASPEAAGSVFAQQGVSQPGAPSQNPGMQVVQQIQQKMQELEKWATETKTMLDTFDPSLVVLLQPIAAAGMDLTKALTEKAKGSGMERGSPVVPQQPPQSPAAGPQSPGGPQQ